MAAPEFDVYLTGSRDGTPSGQLRIATAIAVRFRVPAPEVAAALAGTACRVGTRLPQAEAQGMVDALSALGGEARSTPAGTPVGASPAEAAAGSLADPGSGVRVPDRRRITLKAADAHDPPVVVGVTEQMEFAEPGPDGRTGVRGADIVRCQIHGLAYNRRQASGCLRCLAPARARAKTLEDAGVAARAEGAGVEEDRPDERRTHWLRGRFPSPARRALWGVVVALAVGFVPAAYHVRATTRRRAIELRVEQAQVATLPVTVASLARFDALDVQVQDVHQRGAGETLLIWVAVSGAAAFVWSRLV